MNLHEIRKVAENENKKYEKEIFNRINKILDDGILDKIKKAIHLDYPRLYLWKSKVLLGVDYHHILYAIKSEEYPRTISLRISEEYQGASIGYCLGEYDVLVFVNLFGDGCSCQIL